MNKRILIVDDEPMIREIFKEAFEDAGYFADEAANGRDAFRLVQQTAYDCVLSDVRMPGGDGFELAKNIFTMAEPKPVMYLVTGFSDLNTQKAKEWGVLKIFDKPFNFRDILDEVSAAIGKTPAVRPA